MGWVVCPYCRGEGRREGAGLRPTVVKGSGKRVEGLVTPEAESFRSETGKMDRWLYHGRIEDYLKKPVGDIIYKPKMGDKYRAFSDLNDAFLLEQIKNRLKYWDDKTEEAIRTKYKIWSENELLELVDAFGLFNSSLQFGLPNELFQLFLDRIIMTPTYKKDYWKNRE